MAWKEEEPQIGHKESRMEEILLLQSGRALHISSDQFQFSHLNSCDCGAVFSSSPTVNSGLALIAERDTTS